MLLRSICVMYTFICFIYKHSTYKDDIIGNVQPDIRMYINNNCSMFFIGFLKILAGPVSLYIASTSVFLTLMFIIYTSRFASTEIKCILTYA